MVFSFLSEDIAGLAGDSLVILTPEFDTVSGKLMKRLDEAGRGALSTMLAAEEFTGKEGQSAVILNPDGFKARRIVLAGLGAGKKVDADAYRRAAGRLSTSSAIQNSESLLFAVADATDPAFLQATVEGFVLGGYRQLEFKTGDGAKEKTRTKRMTFVTDTKRPLKRVQKAVEVGFAIAEGQTLVRRLAGTPSNHLTPKIYARKAQEMAKKYGVKCTVLDEAAIKKEKMGALLSVAQGSPEPPRFVVLEYNGGRAGSKPIVLVGKGVTFDSGGISLKSALNMHEMKGDMAGSAVVLSTLMTAARLGLSVNLVGLIPMSENMPSGTATKPGDIFISRKGLTIEVINTDAEGRLLLADALDYANKFNPQAVIDVATLTGATLYILGYAGAPILGNNEALIERLRAASDATAEKVWPLPIWDEMRDQMKSPIADLTNSGGKPAGTIAAAAFLENFIGDWPWAHVDIAYVDVEPGGKPYVPKGTTGFGLRLFIDMLSKWKKL